MLPTVRQLSAGEGDSERANSWGQSADHKSGGSSFLKGDLDHASLCLSHILGHGESERDLKVGL